jgi:hypothetical protein
MSKLKRLWAKSSLALVCLSFLSLLVFVGQPALAKGHKHGVSATITVNASVQQVWQAIVSLRSAEPNRRKLVSYENKQAVLEEKFCSLPIIGAAVCTYVECEEPQQKRIDYHLVSSNRFKAFEGAWTLAPSIDGKGTIVHLSSYLETGVRVPFAREITNTAALHDIERRLSFVKQHAELAQAKANSTTQKVGQVPELSVISSK